MISRMGDASAIQSITTKGMAGACKQQIYVQVYD